MALPISRVSLRQAGMVLLALYFVMGALYSFVLAPAGRFPDEFEYLSLSDHLRHGPGYSMDGVHPTASRPPGYPFFLAGIQALGGNVAAVRIAQYLLLIGTIFLVSRFVGEKDRSTSLLIATCLTAIYPVLFYTSATFYPQTLAGFLFVLAMVLLVSGPPRGVLDPVVGFTFGLLILVVPTFALTLIVVLVAAGVLKIIRWRDSLLIFGCAFIVIVPWTARNAIRFHQFVPVASNSGNNFLIGNCENTNPTGGSGNIDRSHYKQEAVALGLDEFQEDRYYRNAALRWIQQHPGRALVLYFEKAANFFNVVNKYAPENQALVSPWKQGVQAVSYILLLALVGWRLMEARRFPLLSREKLFLLVYFLSAFTGAIFFTRIRLRLPYDYLIIAVIALHLSRRLQAWMELPPTKSI